MVLEDGFPAIADVVVIGSGGAGLTAAIVAHDKGAKVVVLEKSSKVGGTTAMSGGAVWIPMNHHMAALGAEDSRERALTYCLGMAGERATPALVEAFVDNGQEMVRHLEMHTPLRFAALRMPDYRSSAPGAMLEGRCLAAKLYSLAELGEQKRHLRRSPIFVVPITIEEVFIDYQAFYRPQNIPMDLMVERIQAEIVACGEALVAPLFKACLDRDIPIVLNARARRLIQDNGRVVGVELEQKGQRGTVAARNGVILASGGFEWDESLKKAFLPGPIAHPNSLPFNEGDGLRMAMEVGASLANMTETWGYPTALVPGESYEGKPLARPIKAERAAPHCILVNGSGERFVNESANYNDLAKTFSAYDATNFGKANLPCWAIFDAQYRENYSVLTAAPGDPEPTWLIKADTLGELAEKTALPAARLEATVEHWNSAARNHVDPDFHRGESHFDRFQGDHQAVHPSIGSIDKAPYYALQIHPGTLGTKGGPVTDDKGQVLNTRDEPIAGLYGAGNVISSPTAEAYWGPGGTIGPAMTWGYLCALNIGRAAPRAG